MKKIILFISLFAMLPMSAQRMNRARLSDLKISVKQLMRDPIKNEKKIRSILNQIESEDTSWVSDKLDELNSALGTKKLPRILPGVPTPREYMPTKEEPTIVSSPEQEYEKPPAYEPTSTGRDIPQESPPSYEENYYALPPIREMPPVEEAPAYNPPAYEARAKQLPKKNMQTTHHRRIKQSHTS